MNAIRERYKIQQLIDITCEELNISKVALFSRRRVQDIVDARMIINHILTKYSNKTFQESGRVLHRTKANMAWLESKFMDIYRTNKVFQNRYKRIVNRLYNNNKTK